MNAANYTDRFIGELWSYLQTDIRYKDKTTMIITSDHGRGDNAENWKQHNKKIEHADQIWFAVIGPDTEVTGEQTPGLYYQNQLAKTLAAFLGLDYKTEKEVGKAVTSMMKR